jgi:hypothetical protein
MPREHHAAAISRSTDYRSQHDGDFRVETARAATRKASQDSITQVLGKR